MYPRESNNILLLYQRFVFCQVPRLTLPTATVFDGTNSFTTTAISYSVTNIHAKPIWRKVHVYWLLPNTSHNLDKRGSQAWTLGGKTLFKYFSSCVVCFNFSIENLLKFVDKRFLCIPMEFKHDMTELAHCLQFYSEELVKAKTAQTIRQLQTHPCRTVRIFYIL